jgi:hypothetical protein
MPDFLIATGVNMTRITFSQLIAGAFVSLCLATAPAGAVSFTTYVSGKGADTGGCATPATACRTFAYAIGQTAISASSGGTIIAIDPANYGPVTINKAINIVADGGGPAGIFITTGAAITITVNNASGPNVVNLRGLTLDGAGTASAGIVNPASSMHGANVTITDCVIRHFNGDGVAVDNAESAFYISNPVSSNNNGNGLYIAAVGIPGHQVFVDRFTAIGDVTGIDVVGRHLPAVPVMLRS